LIVPPDNVSLDPFIKKANVFVVAFSPSIKTSFLNLPKYLKQVKEIGGSKVYFLFLFYFYFILFYFILFFLY